VGHTLKTPDSVKTKLPAESIRNTPATFNANAIAPFAAKVRNPTFEIALKGADPSMNGSIQPIIIVQIYCVPILARRVGAYARSMEGGTYRSVK